MSYSRERLPNLFIPGASRSGTTSMHVQLNGHPDIFMTPRKEPHYLCRDDKGLDDYGPLFHSATGYKYRGESSTGYMLLPEVTARIQEFMPDAKFILMFRNPVDRAWSHYWHIRGGSGAESAGFREAFVRSMNEPRGFAMYDKQYHQTGLYAHWLQQYLEAVGPERVQVVILEEFSANPQKTLHALCQFLEISDLDAQEALRLNASKVVRFPRVLRLYAYAKRLAGNTLMKRLPDSAYDRVRAGNRQVGGRLRRLLGSTPPPSLGIEDREWVAGFYRDEVARLRELTRNPLSSWTDFSG